MIIVHAEKEQHFFRTYKVKHGSNCFKLMHFCLQTKRDKENQLSKDILAFTEVERGAVLRCLTVGVEEKARKPGCGQLPTRLQKASELPGGASRTDLWRKNWREAAPFL